MRRVIKKPFASFEIDNKGNVVMFPKGIKLGEYVSEAELSNPVFDNFYLYKRWKRQWIKEWEEK